MMPHQNFSPPPILFPTYHQPVPAMNAQEEQEQELEVLESIYPDELTVISPTQFTIQLALDTPSDRKHALLLHITYPPTYPEAIPGIDVTVTEADEEEEEEYSDEEDEDDGNKLIHLSETIEFEKADLNLLKTKLNEEAELNIGMPSIFALATQLKDEAEARFESKLNRAQKEYDEALLAKEKEEQKKFNGTEVTKESWLAWRNKFREEMNYEQKDKERYIKMHNGKMTGREIFEKGLAGNEDNEDIVGELAENVKKVAV